MRPMEIITDRIKSNKSGSLKNDLSKLFEFESLYSYFDYQHLLDIHLNNENGQLSRMDSCSKDIVKWYMSKTYRRNAKVLHPFCGPGKIYGIMQLLNSGINYLGVDINPYVVEYACKEHGQRFLKMNFEDFASYKEYEVLLLSYETANQILNCNFNHVIEDFNNRSKQIIGDLRVNINPSSNEKHRTSLSRLIDDHVWYSLPYQLYHEQWILSEASMVTDYYIVLDSMDNLVTSIKQDLWVPSMEDLLNKFSGRKLCIEPNTYDLSLNSEDYKNYLFAVS